MALSSPNCTDLANEISVADRVIGPSITEHLRRTPKWIHVCGFRWMSVNSVPRGDHSLWFQCGNSTWLVHQGLIKPSFEIPFAINDIAPERPTEDRALAPVFAHAELSKSRFRQAKVFSGFARTKEFIGRRSAVGGARGLRHFAHGCLQFRFLCKACGGSSKRATEKIYIKQILSQRNVESYRYSRRFNLMLKGKFIYFKYLV